MEEPITGDVGTGLASNLTANATALEFEEPDPEEVQHAVLAFYLVVSSLRLGDSGRPAA